MAIKPKINLTQPSPVSMPSVKSTLDNANNIISTAKANAASKVSAAKESIAKVKSTLGTTKANMINTANAAKNAIASTSSNVGGTSASTTTKIDTAKGINTTIKKSGGVPAMAKKVTKAVKKPAMYKGKSTAPGKGGSFAMLKDKLKQEGKSENSAEAIAASVGRKKYGTKQMASWSSQGKKKATKKKGK